MGFTFRKKINTDNEENGIFTPKWNLTVNQNGVTGHDERGQETEDESCDLQRCMWLCCYYGTGFFVLFHHGL